MITGTIAGAAKMLNVSAPGVSRLMKYTEKSLGIKLFERQGGRYIPTPEAHDIFEQINGVYQKVDDLYFTIRKLDSGGLSELRIASVPSIANVMVPRAIEKVCRRFPDLKVEINILKIEEAADYLLLGKGELVAMSAKIEHPAIDLAPLASGELLCAVPQAHELASRQSISASDIVRYPLIGIDPNDPYGRVITEIFTRGNLQYDMAIKARFGTTACSLVKANLGIAVIDQFTVAHDSFPGVKLLKIKESTKFDTFIATKKGKPHSLYAEYFVKCLRAEMAALQTNDKPARVRGKTRSRR